MFKDKGIKGLICLYINFNLLYVLENYNRLYVINYVVNWCLNRKVYGVCVWFFSYIFKENSI